MSHEPSMALGTLTPPGCYVIGPRVDSVAKGPGLMSHSTPRVCRESRGADSR